MGLAERGWNAYPAWEELRGAQEQQAFNKALALYYEKSAIWKCLIGQGTVSISACLIRDCW